MGGRVKGGQILGQYPSDITEKSQLNLGRGRIKPTTSWDALWYGVAQWFGIEDDAALDEALPFRKHLDDEVFSDADLFINSANVDQECSEEELVSLCGQGDGRDQSSQSVRRTSTEPAATKGHAGAGAVEVEGKFLLFFIVIIAAVACSVSRVRKANA